MTEQITGDISPLVDIAKKDELERVRRLNEWFKNGRLACEPEVLTEVRAVSAEK